MIVDATVYQKGTPLLIFSGRVPERADAAGGGAGRTWKVEGGFRRSMNAIEVGPDTEFLRPGRGHP